MINVTRFIFLLTCLHTINTFSSALSSEAIQINELGSIVQKLHTYTTFFLLQFIFDKKLQVVVGYRFFFCQVYIFIAIKLLENTVTFIMRINLYFLRSADKIGRPFCCCIVFSLFLSFFKISFPLSAFCDFSAIFLSDHSHIWPVDR